MNKRSAGAAGLVVAATVAAWCPAGIAAASSEATLVPMVSRFKTCDFQLLPWVSATGTGSGDAVIGQASGGVTAHVRLATAAPNTRYTVRLIQVPRSSSRTCTAGDPGVAVGELFTDAVGSATTTVKGALMPGATGAWVSIDGPPQPGQTIGEFYTSEMLASLA